MSYHEKSLADGRIRGIPATEDALLQRASQATLARWVADARCTFSGIIIHSIAEKPHLCRWCQWDRTGHRVIVGSPSLTQWPVIGLWEGKQDRWPSLQFKVENWWAESRCEASSLLKGVNEPKVRWPKRAFDENTMLASLNHWLNL